jgi:hypothetical protein
MSSKLIYLIPCFMVVVLGAGAAVGGVAYPAPDGWWTYIYTGNTAGNTLDGTWDHDNGSDEWDGSEIGSGVPGGVSALSEDGVNFVRIQETGDPRDHGESDPSNRKIYFGHSITDELPAEVADSILDNGITISFRARLSTTPPLDDLNPDGGGATSPWPEAGDGYLIHDGGKGSFGICQDGPTNTISFCLALASDDDELETNGLVMNKLNGTSPSGDVDLQGDEPGTVNILPIEDLTVWHEFWINIEADNSGQGTHVVTIYVDGDVSNPSTFNVTAGSSSDLTGTSLALGAGATPQAGAFDVDFFAYKVGILTPADIYTASNPIPADGAIIEDVWVNLSWVQGASGASHNVYFGDNFDGVSDDMSDSFIGNQTNTDFIVGIIGYPYEEGLVNGKTYFWRIDEVEADGTTIHKGNVWSFTVPPKTAYAPNPADGAELVDLNAKLSWTAGFGAKLHYVYFGEDFDDVNDAVQGMLSGTKSYDPGPLDLAKTYYWRVDEFEGPLTYKGNVWSFTTVGAVNSPNPADGDGDVKPTQILTWDAGTVAASHEVYFGTDANAVKNATKASTEYKGSKALGEENYNPGKLTLNTTYYWRIDEVNNVNPDGPWKGNVWSFTTGDFFVIDDFEDYDVGNNEIWWAWKDGLGYVAHDNEPAYPGNGTGSAVGDETTASYTEEIIVHGGDQSMPFFYDNNKQGYANYSEAEFTLTIQRDWTEEGVAELSLWFRGSSDNAAEPLYLAVSNRTGTPAVIVYGDPAAAQIGTWTEWMIPLQTFADQGIDLTGVDRIALGVGTRGNTTTPGGSGKMFYDDIRLYRNIEVDSE